MLPFSIHVIDLCWLYIVSLLMGIPIRAEFHVYHGCFEDDTWTAEVPYYDYLTIEWCVQHCYVLAYPYAGLQCGAYCRCMEEYSEVNRRTEQECNTGCTGNSQEICGGVWRQSIYNTANQERSTIEATQRATTKANLERSTMEATQRATTKANLERSTIAATQRATTKDLRQRLLLRQTGSFCYKRKKSVII